MNDELDKARVDDLQRCGLRILQQPGAFCFGTDAVLLAHFAAVKKRDRLVDLGTGTGILPLLIHAKHGFESCLALEIRPDAAELAKRSVALNALERKIEVREMDYLTLPDKEPSLRFDSLVCNPPYVKSGAGETPKNPGQRIARHETVSCLGDIVRCASRLLKNGGYASFVIQASRLVEIFSLMQANGIAPKRLCMVHHRLDTRPSLALVTGRRNGGEGLSVLPPIILRRKDGAYTAKARAIYGADT